MGRSFREVRQAKRVDMTGLEPAPSRRFAGRIAFWCPVDIQATMAHGTLDEIRAYCHKLVTHLGTDKGGFLPTWYADPAGAGHRREAVDAMCREFLAIGG